MRRLILAALLLPTLGCQDDPAPYEVVADPGREVAWAVDATTNKAAEQYKGTGLEYVAESTDGKVLMKVVDGYRKGITIRIAKAQVRARPATLDPLP